MDQTNIEDKKLRKGDLCFLKEKLLALLFILSCYTCFAQTVLTESSLLIKPKFTKDETKTYLVNEKYKIETGTIRPIKAEHDFKITFTIIDTIDGHTILYKAELLKTTNKRTPSESLRAQLTDGITLTYKLNKNGWVIALPDYQRERARVIRKLDSMVEKEKFEKDDKVVISLLRKNLNENDGLQTCLTPLIFFNDIFTKPMFRDRKDYHPMWLMNIFYQPKIPGTAILELHREKTTPEIPAVTIDFIANRDSAAKYFAPIYQEAYYALKGKSIKSSITEMKITSDREYDISHPSGTPLEINIKTVEFYLLKTVTTTTMKLVSQ